jgi:RimJ/RimL family protein N-acetyltransferase
MIEGVKVRLRAVERGDLPLFVKWINDPGVTEHLLLEPPISMEEEEMWYEHQLKGGDKVLCIETKEGRPIGNIAMMNLDWDNRKTDIGIMIGEPDCWSQGYGTDAIITLLRYIFGELNLNRVGLFTDITNKRALRCYEKCGFKAEGVLREYRYKRGHYVDEVQMSILRQDWEEQGTPKRKVQRNTQG